MRTTLEIDEDALAAASKVARARTKTGVINEALRDMARRRALHELLELRGRFAWEGDLDELRGRTRPAKPRHPARPR